MLVIVFRYEGADLGPGSSARISRGGGPPLLHPGSRGAEPDSIGRKHAGETARGATRCGVVSPHQVQRGLKRRRRAVARLRAAHPQPERGSGGRVREHRVEGRVRLGVMDDYGTLIVPPLLAGFIANYPLIDVEMETGLTSSMTDRLGNTYNIVIAMHPEGHSEGELLRREQAVWAASAEHRVEELDPLP